MKNKMLIIFLAFIAGNPVSILSWDSTAAKFYPLAVGNLWSYHRYSYALPLGCTTPTSQSNYIQQIVSDTLLPNGHRYFKFSGYIGIYYQRIDSSTMNVLEYRTAGECLIDSLLARKNDTFRICGSLNIVNDTPMVYFGGQNRRTKQIIFLSGSRTLMLGIGQFTNNYCELFQGFRDTLNGCIINGIQYGTIIGINHTSEEISTDFELYQNYPNPFNPVTEIKYSLPKEAHVTIKVFNIAGKLVKTLVNNEQKNAGNYSIIFDGTAYASGVYFYKIEAGNFVQSRKMVLLK